MIHLLSAASESGGDSARRRCRNRPGASSSNREAAAAAAAASSSDNEEANAEAGRGREIALDVRLGSSSSSSLWSSNESLNAQEAQGRQDEDEEGPDPALRVSSIFLVYLILRMRGDLFGRAFLSVVDVFICSILITFE